MRPHDKRDDNEASRPCLLGLFRPHAAASAILPAGFIKPTTAHCPPSGNVWLHEIEHDGFRVVARKDGAPVKLLQPAWL